MKKKLNAIYVMHSLDLFAGSLVGIFIPIYLLKLDYSLAQILIYYIINSIGIAVFFFAAGYITTAFGLKKNFFIRLPFLFASLLIFYNLGSVKFPLSLLAIIGSAQVGLYWFSLHILFASHADGGAMGNNVGKLNAWPKVLTTFGPLIGGFLAARYGFKTLFLASIFLYIISVGSLLFIKEIKLSVKFSFKNFIALFKKYKKFSIVSGVLRINDMTESVIWPVFIFLSFKNIISVGAAGTLLGLGSIIFTLLVGNFSDKYSKKKIIKIGSAIMMLIWLGRYYFNNEAIAYLSTVLAGFFSILILIPFSSAFYKYAKNDIADEFIIFSEVFINIGRVFVLSLALLLVGNIKLTFIVSALSLLFLSVF